MYYILTMFVIVTIVIVMYRFVSVAFRGRRGFLLLEGSQKTIMDCKYIYKSCRVLYCMELKPVEELGYQEFIDREMIKCPECGFLAPPRQIKNIGEMCERCYIEDGKKVIKGEKLNPEHNLVDRYKLNTGEI